MCNTPGSYFQDTLRMRPNAFIFGLPRLAAFLNILLFANYSKKHLWISST